MEQTPSTENGQSIEPTYTQQASTTTGLIKEPLSELYDDGLTDACHILKQLDYDLLCMKQIPTDSELENAKNIRAIWFSSCYILSVLFLLCLLGFLPWWLGGLIGAVLFLLGLTYVDGYFPLFPGADRYIKLLTKKRQLEFELKHYIKTIEGSLGFIHLLQPLNHFNKNMEKHYFKRLCTASAQHVLIQHLNQHDEFQLYYQYLMEALEASSKRDEWLSNQPHPDNTDETATHTDAA